jgi:hypothetical protein
MKSLNSEVRNVRRVLYYAASAAAAGVGWAVMCRLRTGFAPCRSTYYLWCVGPLWFWLRASRGRGRALARIGPKLAIAGRDYGKGEGGSRLRPAGWGHSGFRSVLAVAKGARSPPALWNPRPLRAFPPPSLVSILIRVRHVAGVSPESYSFPARVAAFRVGPLGDASSARGGAGGCGARRSERPTAGVGRGRSRHTPRRIGVRTDLLGRRDVGGRS